MDIYEDIPVVSRKPAAKAPAKSGVESRGISSLIAPRALPLPAGANQSPDVELGSLYVLSDGTP